MKGLRKHILDFEIVPTGNPKTLVFVDASEYRDVPERPLLEVILPGYNKYFLVNIVANRVNTLNSNIIGLTSLLNGDELVNLPDGAYNLRYKICPYTTTYIDKVHFRTTLIEQQLGDLYEKIDTSECCNKNSELFAEIAEVYSLIEGAKIIACRDDEKAHGFYQLASKLIDKISKKLDKSCC